RTGATLMSRGLTAPTEWNQCRLSEDGSTLAWSCNPFDPAGDPGSFKLSVEDVASGRRKMFRTFDEDGLWKLSPDGRHLAFLQKGSASEPTLTIVDVLTGCDILSVVCNPVLKPQNPIAGGPSSDETGTLSVHFTPGSAAIVIVEEN